MALKRMPTPQEVELLLNFIEAFRTWQSDDYYAEMCTAHHNTVRDGEKLIKELTP